ncbi:MAG: hypothetical protein GY926_01825, partial [bacterium]|nr:hypothetical protein [bacterium]
GTDYDFALTRYNTDGSLDTSFDLVNTLDGTPTFAEGSATVVLDVDVDVSDSELDALNGGLGNYDGASVTLVRNGGASADDVFSNSGLLGTLTESGALDYNGTTIGTVTTNSGGTLLLTFNTNATSALVDSTLQSIAYSNSSDNPPATAQIDWSFDDGNTGSQGSGGALQAVGSTTVTITAVNDAPTFDLGDGVVPTPVGSGADAEGRSITLQSDGKVLVAGWSDSGSGYEFSLVRFNPDGTLDTAFDTDGIVTTDMASGTADAFAHSVTVQSDGKILIAGYGLNGGGDNDFALVRYNSNGGLDTTFNTTGKVSTPIGTNTEDQAYSVTLQDDGKILVAGYSHNGIDNDLALVRYNSDGSLDVDFDGDTGTGNGIVTTDIGSAENYGYSVTVQSDGKILVAGSHFNGTDYDFAVVRYNSDGTLDVDFDGDTGTGNGIVTTDIGVAVGTTDDEDHGRSITLQSDGKILVAGWSDKAGGRDFALVRYNTDGTLDTSFDTDGIVTTDVAPGNADAYAYDVTVQSDGKILVTGYGNAGAGNQEFMLVRYDSDGSRDTGFGSNGVVNNKVLGGADYAYSAAVQSDGKILVVGNDSNDFELRRYNSDGTLDTTYGTYGSTLDGTPTFIEGGAAVVLDV